MGTVEVLVIGHDDVGVAGDAQASAVDTLALERVELLEHDGGVDNAAVTNDGQNAVIHDTRGNLVKRELVAVGDNRVTGVRATLVAADAIKITGDEVGDLTLAFVAPLGTNQNSCRHEELLLLRLSQLAKYTTEKDPG